ncbi:MAG: hypothetical protein H8K11_15825 [Nitrospira sp.]|nr:hypothetical protein [Nitrospira sp.]
MTETRNDEWWLRLYNAKNNDELYMIAYEHAGRLTRSANAIRKILPKMMDALDNHWESYKEFVNKWLDDTLTDKDWAKARIWIGRDLEHEELLPQSDISLPLSSFLINCMKNNPHEPLTDAYKQVIARISKVRSGLPYIRPLFCSACRQLFEPRQREQRWCSARCRNRQMKREYRAKKGSKDVKADHDIEKATTPRPSRKQIGQN